jgi:hypothetical protein
VEDLHTVTENGMGPDMEHGNFALVGKGTMEY